MRIGIDSPTVNASTTRQALAGIASGNPEAFTLFYNAWFDRLLAYVMRLTRRDESFCMDVVQDCMIKLIGRARVFDDDKDLERWMHSVATNAAIDRLRQEKRRSRREVASCMQSVAPDPDAAGDRIELIDRLMLELESLDPQRSAMLRLRVAAGWTLERIGSWAGLSAGAVDGRITRALTAIRRTLEEAGHDRVL